MASFSPSRTGQQTVDRNLDQLQKVLASIPAGIGVVPTWQAPTLATGWANQGLPYPPAGYWKDANGIVWVKGKLQNTTAGNLTGAILSPGLPAGYRPAEEREFACFGWTGAASTTYYAWIKPDGSVSLDGSTVPSGAQLSLMFSFPGEQ